MWTPLRVLLLAVGTVALGVALSLLLGSSPAHAAESADPGSGGDLVGGVSTSVSHAVDQTATAVAPVVTSVAAPLTQRVEPALRAPIASAVTAPIVSAPIATAPIATAPIVSTVHAITDPVVSASPVLATILTPITGMLDTTLGSVGQVISPSILVSRDAVAVDVVAAATSRTLTAAAVLAVADSPVGGSIHATVAAVLPAGDPLPASGGIPASVVMAAPTVPLGLLGTLLGAIAIATIGVRRRASDDELPSSPIFETDTSPA